MIRWVNLNGFNNYNISQCGKIMNINSGRILNNNTLSSGYQVLRLRCEDDKIKSLYVHHLVAKTFNGACPPGHTIDHIDRNKQNNHINNLRYISHRDNCLNTGPANGKRFKGVYLYKGDRYIVRFNKVYIGTFRDEVEAARAYNIVAGLYSPYCYLNEIE